MKIVVLAAGVSKYFPLFIDKPKCLYHKDGEVQLARVINMAKNFVNEQDIIVLAGYKYPQVQRYLSKNYPNIKMKINKNYDGPAVYSFRAAIEGIDDDVVFMLGDENISFKNVKKICDSTRGMAIMCHDQYYYYSLGIMKIRRDNLYLFNDDNYLSMNYMKEVYCFANNKTEYDGNFDINSGICLGYMTIDIVRRIGKIEAIENPNLCYDGNDIDFIHYNPELEYISDIDYIEDTDEYSQNVWLRIYTKIISTPLKRGINFIKRLFNS